MKTYYVETHLCCLCFCVNCFTPKHILKTPRSTPQQPPKHTPTYPRKYLRASRAGRVSQQEVKVVQTRACMCIYTYTRMYVQAVV